MRNASKKSFPSGNYRNMIQVPDKFMNVKDLTNDEIYVIHFIEKTKKVTDAKREWNPLYLNKSLHFHL